MFIEYFGGADGIRTHDLLDAIEARSQLRHGPTGENYFQYFTSGDSRRLSRISSHSERVHLPPIAFYKVASNTLAWAGACGEVARS
jgi:hypothetical protein